MSNRHRRERIHRGQRAGPARWGAAAVEFAIVSPLFFMLIIGCIEFGRALMVQQVLTNSSRVGARQAITLNATESEAVTAASEFAVSAAVSGTTVTVSPNPASSSAGDMISVTVSVPFDHVSWIPAPWFMGGATLDATSVMRKEGFE